MKIPVASLCALFLIFYVSISTGQDFDFFYFVQQWPGSYCDTKQSCCYPTTGKPEADFSIHGLWPNYNDGSYPSDCDPDNPFDSSKISNLIPKMQSDWPTLACPSGNGLKFWKHEWEKHGTCSESVLDHHAYFETALKLKDQLNLLQILKSSGNKHTSSSNPSNTILRPDDAYFIDIMIPGIEPDGGFYGLKSIKEAIKEGTGYTPGIECNVDESRNSQLYQIYMCVDSSGTSLINCPLFPRNRCSSQIEFPSF
ncbi:Ribonuclease 1 [Acorus gramineus]|uniref:Ribonuclease 1 n=1 Tax=Acorus gramineus TaxID=55184 RepID=A0AAV9A971_ACOGR|nr:Ribonuclease 1 [Acorus gramineus]